MDQLILTVILAVLAAIVLGQVLKGVLRLVSMAMVGLILVLVSANITNSSNSWPFLNSNRLGTPEAPATLSESQTNSPTPTDSSVPAEADGTGISDTPINATDNTNNATDNDAVTVKPNDNISRPSSGNVESLPDTASSSSPSPPPFSGTFAQAGSPQDPSSLPTPSPESAASQSPTSQQSQAPATETSSSANTTSSPVTPPRAPINALW